MYLSRSYPGMFTDDPIVNTALRISIADLYGNIVPFKDGVLDEPKPVIMAGMQYDTPWTRDASIQAWNGSSLFFPDATEQTLLSVLIREGDMIRAGGQYWDAIIWVTGAWRHYLHTGNSNFLNLAYEASVNSIRFFEQTEFDDSLCLFRGAACYGDGVSAYDDSFVSAENTRAGILDWPIHHPKLAAAKGEGLPMYVLSTNCLYYNAYILIYKMECELRYAQSDEWISKAERLKASINKMFWREELGRYLYYLSPFGECPAQETLGLAFSILTGIAGQRRTQQIMENCYSAPAGIPCVWPNFHRYELEENTYGRHSGTIWPFIQAFWADAAAKAGRGDLMLREYALIAQHAVENGQCSELYHPISGKPYGGVQEWDGKIVEWKSCMRQSWSATGFLRVSIIDILGMKFTTKGIYFRPHLGNTFGVAELYDLTYQGFPLSVRICRRDRHSRMFAVNGVTRDSPLLEAAHIDGPQMIEIDF